MAREHLQVIASRICTWYDRKVKVQEFLPGDEVYVLNLRLYQKRCPKWLRRYSDVATVLRKINNVTYVICGEAWRSKEKIVHVDKLKLKHRPEAVVSACASALLSTPVSPVSPVVSPLSALATPFVPTPTPFVPRSTPFVPSSVPSM